MINSLRSKRISIVLLVLILATYNNSRVSIAWQALKSHAVPSISQTSENLAEVSQAALTKPSQNPLLTYANAHTGTIIHKWAGYFDVYHEVFQHLRGKPLVFLEIGVNTGGSISMWKNYFGESFEYHGIDLNQKCQRFNGPGVTIHHGSQSDIPFLQKVGKKIGKPIDIVLDDASHYSVLTVKSLEGLWSFVRDDGGIYMVEDLQGQMGFHRYLSEVVAKMHSLHRKESCSMSPYGPDFCKEVYSVNQFHNIAVVKKLRTDQPDTHVRYGVEMPDFETSEYFKTSFFRTVRKEKATALKERQS